MIFKIKIKLIKRKCAVLEECVSTLVQIFSETPESTLNPAPRHTPFETPPAQLEQSGRSLRIFKIKHHLFNHLNFNVFGNLFAYCSLWVHECTLLSCFCFFAL